MKRMILAAVLAGCTLLPQCKKDNNNQPTPANTVSTNTDTNQRVIIPDVPGAMVGYNITPITGVTVPYLKWNLGYLNIIGLRFESIHPGGSAIFNIHYDVPANYQVNVLNNTPLSLGKMLVPFGLYQQTAASLNMAAAQPGGNAFYLSGVYLQNEDAVNAGGENGTSNRITPVPVTIMLNDPMMLTGRLLREFHISPDLSYKMNFTVDMGIVTSPLSATMLNQATKTNGAIIISNTSNTALYNLIINNFQNSVNVSFGF